MFKIIQQYYILKITDMVIAIDQGSPQYNHRPLCINKYVCSRAFHSHTNSTRIHLAIHPHMLFAIFNNPITNETGNNCSVE